MAESNGSERRRHERYDTDLKIEFFVSFDLVTHLDFQVEKEEGKGVNRAKYHGESRNVSAEGLCFVTGQELCRRDILHLNIYIPNAQNPIKMVGRVRWSRSLGQDEAGLNIYDTGVKVIKVNDEDVERSLIFDPAHSIYWSVVLERVFGGFDQLVLEQKKPKSED